MLGVYALMKEAERPEKKRVLFLINQLFRGGAEIALINLLRTMDSAAFDVDLLVFDQLELPGSLSLLPEVPAWVNVVNAAEREGNAAFLTKAVFKIVRRLTGEQPQRRSAVRYLRGRYYDAAISYGEWFSSALAALYTAARRKYVWVHADMDKAAFLHPDILRYEGLFDGFLFASRRSLEAAAEKYPQLRARSYVVPNRIDSEKILAMSEESTDIFLPEDGLPRLLTAANVREEKNHLRQVEVMRRLFDEGLRFHWINVGSLANVPLVSRLREAVRSAGLEEYFHLCGAMENPYAVMRRADAVCVLSDHESWSMVITEALALGVPVIATRTSGALEQVQDGVTGLLCGFSAREIAETLRRFFATGIPGGPGAAASAAAGELETLLENDMKKVLYAFDDINYASGARSAALAQARAVSGVAEVWLYSAEPCRSDALRREFRFLEPSGSAALRLLAVPTRQLLRDGDVSRRHKLLRLAYAALARLGMEPLLPNALLRRSMTAAFESFDTVFVVSEASRLRGFVSRLSLPAKIQWIHTDYAAWRESSEWTRAVTKRDAALYRRFDSIVCLNRTLREKFLAVYPFLAEKTLAVPNPVCCAGIRARAAAPLELPVDGRVYNLVTIGRMEPEKRFDRLLCAAALLRERGLSFHWYFVGGGSLRGEIERQRSAFGLDGCVTLTGHRENPCPLLAACDALVLYSAYEGTPVTVDEAKALGVRVIAPDIGGIREQLGDAPGEITENTVTALADAIFRAAAQKKSRRASG